MCTDYFQQTSVYVYPQISAASQIVQVQILFNCYIEDIFCDAGQNVLIGHISEKKHKPFLFWTKITQRAYFIDVPCYQSSAYSIRFKYAVNTEAFTTNVYFHVLSNEKQ